MMELYEITKYMSICHTHDYTRQGKHYFQKSKSVLAGSGWSGPLGVLVLNKKNGCNTFPSKQYISLKDYMYI